MDKNIYNEFVELLNQELIPALGCTEPIAIAYAAAKARDILKHRPEKIKVGCSGNIIKNVQGVVVPNSGGQRGINVAATLGVVAGNADKELEVLQTITDEDREETKNLILKNYSQCYLIEEMDNLYIRVDAFYKEETSTVIVASSHTNIIHISLNNKIIYHKSEKIADEQENGKYSKNLTIKNITDFADNLNVEDVKFVLEREIKFNTAISNEGLSNDWGIGVGKLITKYYDMNDVRNRAKAAAAAGSDARMGGCALPVVINSGSGNQGMTISLPIIEYAKHLEVDHNLLLRALALANLISMEEKSRIGSLSAYCGAVCAGTAAGCGIAYLHGGRENEISNVITNCLADIGGIVCDGAKSSCASKIATSVNSAILSFEIGMKEKRCFKNGEGLVKDTADMTIRSFGRMGKKGMKSTDTEILNIMLGK